MTEKNSCLYLPSIYLVPERRRKITGRLLLLTSYLTLSTSLLFSQSPLPIIGYLKGDNQNDRLGISLAGPGDVNVDGYADLLAAELGTKKVKLFYGNAGRIDSIPDMIWNGYTSVRTIGDINGDGKPEVVMGTDTVNQLQIFWGRNLLDTIPDFVLTFPPDTVCIGGVGIQDVSSGDLNGDSYGDLVVSTLYTCGGPIFHLGRIQIFWGGPLLDTISDWNRSIPYQASPRREQFGVAAKVLSNLNGDAFADLVAGQNGNDAAGTNGCLHIFLGGNPMDTVEDQLLNSPPPVQFEAFADWGSRIIPFGDLNNDGESDFWIGGAGSLLRLYNGGFPLDSVPVAVLDQGGDRPAPGGDYNRDGFTDLILGQPRPSFLAGSVFIYLGSSSMNGMVDIAIHDYDLQGYVAEVFGLAVINIGDMDGDGVDDFAASAKLDVDPFDVGEVFIFSGDSSIPTGVEESKSNLPRSFTLFQNFPNPFNPITQISYILAKQGDVRLEIFNIAGGKVKTLLQEEQMAGEHQVSWDGTDSFGNSVASGVYLYKMQIGGESLVKKMVLLK